MHVDYCFSLCRTCSHDTSPTYVKTQFPPMQMDLTYSSYTIYSGDLAEYNFRLRLDCC